MKAVDVSRTITMATDLAFAALMQRVREGDPEAATELVRQYEPEIRRAVRIRLTDARLRRTLDSMDICQSVLANFFVRAAAGQFDLEQPEHLLRLLVKMARHKLVDQARHEQAGRRDQRRTQAGGTSIFGSVPAGGDTPSQVVAGRELLAAARRQLTEEEQWLADQRALGREWTALAAERRDSAEALRKKLARAMDRVVRKLGLEEGAAE
jgi:RNA polymerase sigma-70 factor (ECF subfamily)